MRRRGDDLRGSRVLAGLTVALALAAALPAAAAERTVVGEYWTQPG